MDEQIKQNIILSFFNSKLNARKIAKFKIKTDKSRLIKDIFIFQADNPITHFSLHNTQKCGKPTRYHSQLNKNFENFIAKEDRSKYPEIIEENLPDFSKPKKLWPLQAIPFYLRNDIEIYRQLTKRELNNNKEFVIDLSHIKTFLPDPSASFLLESYLVEPYNITELKNKEFRLRDKLFFWKVIKNTNPWILLYVIGYRN